MRVLVTVASKHGATGQIGEFVAGVLRDRGLTVVSRPPEAVRGLSGFDAVVLGSAVYAGCWLEPAIAFVNRHDAELATRPVWLFSSGPLGDPPMPPGEPVVAAAIAARVSARDHRTFAGRLDRELLSSMERTITRGLRVPSGDFRDFGSIRTWADGIAAALVGRMVQA